MLRFTVLSIYCCYGGFVVFEIIAVKNGKEKWGCGGFSQLRRVVIMDSDLAQFFFIQWLV